MRRCVQRCKKEGAIRLFFIRLEFTSNECLTNRNEGVSKVFLMRYVQLPQSFANALNKIIRSKINI